MEEKYVTEEVCRERQKNAAERFSRDKERLEKVEITTDDLKQISVRLDAVIEHQQEQLDNHEKRLETLESKPGKLWDTLVAEIIKLLVSGAVGALLAYLTIKP